MHGSMVARCFSNLQVHFHSRLNCTKNCLCSKSNTLTSMCNDSSAASWPQHPPLFSLEWPWCFERWESTQSLPIILLENVDVGVATSIVQNEVGLLECNLHYLWFQCLVQGLGMLWWLMAPSAKQHRILSTLFDANQVMSCRFLKNRGYILIHKNAHESRHE